MRPIARGERAAAVDGADDAEHEQERGDRFGERHSAIPVISNTLFCQVEGGGGDSRTPAGAPWIAGSEYRGSCQSAGNRRRIPTDQGEKLLTPRPDHPTISLFDRSIPYFGIKSERRGDDAADPRPPGPPLHRRQRPLRAAPRSTRSSMSTPTSTSPHGARARSARMLVALRILPQAS